MKRAELMKILKERVKSKYPSREVIEALPALVNEFFLIINEELQKGNEVNLGKLGRFKVKELRKEGKEAVQRIIRFIPSKVL